MQPPCVVISDWSEWTDLGLVRTNWPVVGWKNVRPFWGPFLLGCVGGPEKSRLWGPTISYNCMDHMTLIAPTPFWATTCQCNFLDYFFCAIPSFRWEPLHTASDDFLTETITVAKTSVNQMLFPCTSRTQTSHIKKIASNDTSMCVLPIEITPRCRSRYVQTEKSQVHPHFYITVTHRNFLPLYSMPYSLHGLLNAGQSNMLTTSETSVCNRNCSQQQELCTVAMLNMVRFR
jgi:hypothetical protein